jgi:hypothetical protein
MDDLAALPATQWLLEHASAPARYRTLTELLDRPPDDPQVVAARAAIPADKAVRKIFTRMNPGNYWLHRGQGDGLGYAMSSSTHFVLAFLAELGLERTHDQTRTAAERYLGLYEDPKSRAILSLYDLEKQSCHYAYNIRTFIRLGYKQHTRVQSWIQTLLEDERFDGGYLCVRANFTVKTRSCIRGGIKALSAFAELPEIWQHPRCLQLVDYFLRRRVFFHSRQPQQLIRGELLCASFPFLINGNLLEPLYALSRIGYGQDPALQSAWDLLESKIDSIGRIPLEHTPSSLIFDAGKIGAANEWLTLYALLAWKFRRTVPPRGSLIRN